MHASRHNRIVSCALLCSLATVPLRSTYADEPPLHQRIDTVFETSAVGPLAPAASDLTFARRLYLDLVGRIPSIKEIRAFQALSTESRRSQLVDQLLASEEYPVHMATVFDIMLMERRGGKHVQTAAFRAWLKESFEQDKPFNVLASELIAAEAADGKNVRAAFILEREVEPNLVTREISRMFFGRDMQCAQCHDHPNVDDYKQEDYYGILAFMNRTSLFQPDKKKPAVLSETADSQTSFKSVFTERAAFTAPRVPGEAEVIEPIFTAGEEYTVRATKTVAAVPKYSRRKRLSEIVASGNNEYFRRNIANRLWAHVMGRGLVHPVDMHHSSNPPTNPQLMALLADGIAEQKFSVREYLRQLVLTDVYRRSHRLQEQTVPAVEQLQKEIARLTAEQEQAQKQWATQDAIAQKALEELDKVIATTEPVRAAWTKVRSAATAAAGKHTTALTAQQAKQTAIDQKTQLRTKLQTAMDNLTAAGTDLGDEELKKLAAGLKPRTDKEIAELTKLQTELDAAKKATAAAVDALAKANTAEKTERDKLTPLQQQIHKHRTTLVTGLREGAEAYERVSHATEETTRLEHLIRIQESDARLPALTAELNGVTQKTATQQSAVAETEKQLTAVTAKVKAATTDMTQRSSAVATLKQQLSNQQTAATKLKESSTGLSQAADLLQDDDLKKVLSTVTAASAESQKQVRQLSSDLSAATTALTKSQQSVATLQSQLDVAKLTLSQQSKILTALKIQQEKLTSEQQDLTGKRQEAEESVAKSTSNKFHQAPLESLSPEQLGWSILQCSGQVERQYAADLAKLNKEKPLNEEQQKDPAAVAQREKDARAAARVNLEKQVDTFVKLFGAESGQPQDSFFATVDQALFFANGSQIRGWLSPAGENLTGRLLKIEAAPELASELYLSTLVRQPTAEEVKDVEGYLAARGEQKREAVQELAWALITSAEFRFQH